MAMQPSSPGLRADSNLQNENERLRAEVAALTASLVTTREQLALSRSASARERKEATSLHSEEAHRSRLELHAMFMQAPIAICVLDGPEHIFSMVNPRYEQLAGREVFGKKVRDAFTETEVGPFFDLLDRVYETGEPYIGKESSVPLVGPDGELRERFLDFMYHPLRDSGGRVTAILALLIDVTEQVEARKQLELSAQNLATERQRLAAILAQAPGAVCVFDGPEHVFSLVNQAYVSIFFGGRSDLVGQTVRDAVPEAADQGYVALLDRVYQEGEPYIGTETPIELRQLDGTMKSFYLNLVYQPLRNASDEIVGIVAVIAEVTEQVRTKQALEKANQTLRNERELREQFVAALSHDLRNPLTAAKMCTQLLARSLSDPATVYKLIGRIVDSMDRIDQMIRDLLDTARIKAGEHLPLKCEELDVTYLTQDTLQNLVTIHGDRFVLSIKDQVRVYWDGSAIKRVIENLATNAVKYGSRAAPIAIWIELKENLVEISVHNEGPPIPARDQAVLFDHYQRSESAENSGQKGWGIGLALVRGLAEAHGGKVGVSSSAEAGTTFWVRLPRDRRCESVAAVSPSTSTG